jgi:hypothetical protein
MKYESKFWGPRGRMYSLRGPSEGESNSETKKVEKGTIFCSFLAKKTNNNWFSVFFCQTNVDDETENFTWFSKKKKKKNSRYFVYIFSETYCVKNLILVMG